MPASNNKNNQTKNTKPKNKKNTKHNINSKGKPKSKANSQPNSKQGKNASGGASIIKMFFKPLFILFKISLSLFVVGLFIAVATIVYFSHDLPDHQELKNYAPPITTRIFASDGSLVTKFSKEYRVFTSIDSVPELVKNAFIATEDRRFKMHFGIDPKGILRAAINNMRSNNLQGASTITQQVAKNILLSSEKTLVRKIKEAILAIRMEMMFSKDKILELYLNEIPFGRGTHGIVAASLAYFDKSIEELEIAEIALLAALPKAPYGYNPEKYYQKAIKRRNWVINMMLSEGYISGKEAMEAVSSPIIVKKRVFGARAGSDYFAEEVRKRLHKIFGEKTLYEGGLVVHTTLNPNMQQYAKNSLQEGLENLDKKFGFTRPLANLSDKLHKEFGEELGEQSAKELWKKLGQQDLSGGIKKQFMERLMEQLEDVAKPAGAKGFYKSMVIGKSDSYYNIILETGDFGKILFNSLKWAKKKRQTQQANNLKKTGKYSWQEIPDILKKGDVILVAKQKQTSPISSTSTSTSTSNNIYLLQQVPSVNGAIITIENHTGRVLAAVGGYSFEASKFNRAFQARRQPGSAFKPFVYLAAFEKGFSPADLIADEPIEMLKIIPENEFESGYIYNKDEDVWVPQNYNGKFYGTTSLRKGVEQSINVMTVHLAKVIGISSIIDIANRFDIQTDIQRDFSTALGALSTTPVKITNAYAIIANGGKKINPHLIERVQDRTGKTIFKMDDRKCVNCNIDFSQKSVAVNNPARFFPRVFENKEQISDVESLHQITSVMQGVIERGTGKKAKKIGKPLAGKTGTTNLSKDAWFVGFSPSIATGVYVGFDKPTPMGRQETGSSVALPIFTNFMQQTLELLPTKLFKIPPSIEFVKTDINTGLLPSYRSLDRDIIMESFKNGQAPKRAIIQGEIPPVINSPRYELDGEKQIIDIPITRGTGGVY